MTIMIDTTDELESLETVHDQTESPGSCDDLNNEVESNGESDFSNQERSAHFSDSSQDLGTTPHLGVKSKNEISTELNEEATQKYSNEIGASCSDNMSHVIGDSISDETVDGFINSVNGISADIEEEDYPSIIEALIFASDEPIQFKQLKDIIINPPQGSPNSDSSCTEEEGISLSEQNLESQETSIESIPGRKRGGKKSSAFTVNMVKNIVDRLNNDYRQTGRAFRIVEVAGGFTFQTISDFGVYVGRMFAERTKRRLTQSALETLAIIAFKQPISKSGVEAIRGVNADYVLKSLLEKDLISIVGRDNTVGRPLLYGTTTSFLKHFGLNSLEDLPKPREIQELLADEEALFQNTIEESDEEQINEFTYFLSSEEEHLFDTVPHLIPEHGFPEEKTGENHSIESGQAIGQNIEIIVGEALIDQDEKAPEISTVLDSYRNHEPEKTIQTSDTGNLSSESLLDADITNSGDETDTGQYEEREIQTQDDSSEIEEFENDDEYDLIEEDEHHSPHEGFDDEDYDDEGEEYYDESLSDN